MHVVNNSELLVLHRTLLNGNFVFIQTHGSMLSSLTIIPSKKSKLGIIFLWYVIAHPKQKLAIFVTKTYIIITGNSLRTMNLKLNLKIL